MHTYNKKNKGMSFFEAMLTVAIIGIMVAIVVPTLSAFRNQQYLRNTASDVISLLHQAREKTLSSENSTYYGVHFETARAVLFSGATFVDGAAGNQVVPLDASVTIPSVGGINLNGGDSNLIFKRLTGDTDDYGTIVIRLSSDSTKQKTITINQAGIVSLN